MARQVLPIVGAAVGAYFGGPTGAQIGWTIGSLVGNAVDPQVIKGPSLGDLATQTSQEGVPRPIVFGVSPPMAGNIIACGNPVIKKKDTQQGKGGPVTETEVVYRTYAIGVCEGPINAFLRVWRNGTLVYDVRPNADPSMAKQNANFMKTARFFLGGWDQMPSPDIEAALGAANAPFFRGTAYLVMANEDLTDLRGAVPQYTFQVMRCEATVFTSRPYPLYLPDTITYSAPPTDAELRLILASYPLRDNVSMSIAPSDGQLRSILRTYAPLPELLTMGIVPTDGQLRQILRSYTMQPELLTMSIAPTDGQLKTTLITYPNWPPEGLQMGMAPTGGTLA